MRQKYDECKAGQAIVQGINPKVLAECKNKNKAMSQEIVEKSGVIKSLEQTLTSRDRDYRDAATRNKNLILQIHTQKVSFEEREMLKRSLEKSKSELAQAQKALAQAGGVKVVYKDRPVVQEKIVEKIVYKEPLPVNTKVVEKVVYKDRPVIQEKIVDKIVYKDRPVTSNKVVEKVVYKDRPVVIEKVVYKDKVVEKVVFKDRPVVKEKTVEKIVYKDRPVVTEKVIYKDKIVYRDRPVIQEKIVEKIVYKDRPVVQEKIVEKLTYKAPAPQKFTPKTVIKAEKVIPILPKQQVQKSMTSDEIKRRQEDKIALETERKKSSSIVIKKASPSAYRMVSNAPIYDAINGIQVDKWEAGRSFTSGTSSAGWVKITGYFINRVWQSADTELWVKESDVIRR